MEEMSIEPLLWQLGAGWAIAAFVSALLLASLSEALLKLPKGAASLVLACLFAILGGAAFFDEWAEVRPGSIMASLKSQMQKVEAQSNERAMSRPRTTIRINGESQKNAARALEANLKKNNVYVSGIELVDPKTAPEGMEVRFFHKTDGQMAEGIMRIAGAGSVKLITDYPSAPMGLSDIWFPKTDK
jgi:hypothetical protein